MKNLTVLALIVALAVPSLALAHEEGGGPNTGAIHLYAGVDVTTQYNFRGMNIEDQGMILQPWVAITSQVYSGGDMQPVIEGAKLKVRLWNSIQEASPGTNLAHPQWFEADVSVGVVLDLFYDMTGEIMYVYAQDPELPGNYYEAVEVSLAYDDSALWGGVLDNVPGFKGLQPHVLVAIETDGGVDRGITIGQGGPVAGGGDIYYEIGIEPSICILDSEDWPVTLSVPMTVAFGDDYYEYIDSTGSLDDDSFGYFDVGLVCTVPVKCVPIEHGEWELYAAVHFLFKGDGAEALTTNASTDDSEIIGSAGISMSY